MLNEQNVNAKGYTQKLLDNSLKMSFPCKLKFNLP